MTLPTEVRLPQRHVEHCMGTAFSFDVRFPGVDRSSARIGDQTGCTGWTPPSPPIESDSQINLTCPRGDRAGRLRTRGPRDPRPLRRARGRNRRLLLRPRRWIPRPLGPGQGLGDRARQRDAGAPPARANHCVNGGGDVQCLGQPDAESLWRIGIAHPRRPTDLVGIAAGSHLAVATSGSAERGAHILDPHTRTRPTALASVTLDRPRPGHHGRLRHGRVRHGCPGAQLDRNARPPPRDGRVRRWFRMGLSAARRPSRPGVEISGDNADSGPGCDASTGSHAAATPSPRRSRAQGQRRGRGTLPVGVVTGGAARARLETAASLDMPKHVNGHRRNPHDEAGLVRSEQRTTIAESGHRAARYQCRAPPDCSRSRTGPRTRSTMCGGPFRT